MYVLMSIFRCIIVSVEVQRDPFANWALKLEKRANLAADIYYVNFLIKSSSLLESQSTEKKIC